MMGGMGLLRSDLDKPMSHVVESARAAHDAGRTIFVGKMEGALRGGVSDLWGLTLEAVEDVGWELIHWTISEGSAFPVFRRR